MEKPTKFTSCRLGAGHESYVPDTYLREEDAASEKKLHKQHETITSFRAVSQVTDEALSSRMEIVVWNATSPIRPKVVLGIAPIGCDVR